MQKTTSILKNEEGSVIIIVLLVLALLTVIGITSSHNATTELDISTNLLLHKIAFYAADSGIEAGRAALNELKNDDSSNWDNLLGGNQFEWNDQDVTTLDDVIDTEGGRNVGLATFTLQIRDNNDLDGNNQVDTDNIIILTGTGSYRNAQSQIEVYVRYTGAGGGDQYAQEHYDTASTGVAQGESSDVAQNLRW